jgi:proteasome lid subunit RPN8/RPN11
VWHTHPGGLVGPSSGDLEHAVTGVNYLVVTVPGGEARHFGRLSSEEVWVQHASD